MESRYRSSSEIQPFPRASRWMSFLACSLAAKSGMTDKEKELQKRMSSYILDLILAGNDNLTLRGNIKVLLELPATSTSI
jgi:hypothetical protein